jgi:hypothetical protein
MGPTGTGCPLADSESHSEKRKQPSIQAKEKGVARSLPRRFGPVLLQGDARKPAA